MSKTGMSHYRGNVSKVKVDKSGNVYKVRDALYAAAENVVYCLECVEQSDSRVRNLLQSFVGDNYERVNVLAQLSNSLNCLIHSLRSFEKEGLGYYSNGKDIHLVSYSCNYGSSTRTCSAAHTCGDKYHISAGKNCLDLLYGFLSSAVTDLGLCACSESLSDLLADNELSGCAGTTESLSVCIDSYKLNSSDIFRDHSVDCVISTASNTYNLDTYAAFAAVIVFESHFYILPIFIIVLFFTRITVLIPYTNIIIYFF